MILKILQVSLCIALILSAGPGTVCIGLSPAAKGPFCLTHAVPDDVIGPMDRAPCRIAPCRSEKGPVFTVPDPASSRMERGNQGKSLKFGFCGASETNAVALHPFDRGAFSLNLFSTHAPPSFIIHCSFLC